MRVLRRRPASSESSRAAYSSASAVALMLMKEVAVHAPEVRRCPTAKTRCRPSRAS
jgi:hypothetical protein